LAYTGTDCRIIWNKTAGNNQTLKNIFDHGELNEDSVCSILELTAADGKNMIQKYIILTPLFPSGIVLTH